MVKYPIDKYNIIIHQHPTYNGVEIIALSTYAGKVVKGKAICHVDDTYDQQKGIELAIARCAEKIARKRKARADKMVEKATKQVQEAQRYLDNMTRYALDAVFEVAEAKADLKKILSEM